MHLKGKTGDQIIMQNAVQLILKEEMNIYLRKVEKYIERNIARKDKKQMLAITEFDGINSSNNKLIYEELLYKLKETIYKKRTGNQQDNLIEKEETFTELTLEEQCVLLNEILHLFQCNVVLSNLTLIGLSKFAGSLLNNKFISKNKTVYIIDQSVTGLFEKRSDLLNL